MLVSLRILPEVREQGTFLTVRYLDATEVVGPLSHETEELVILEPACPVGTSTKAKKLRHKATELEDEIAQAIGGRRNKGSGSLPYLKGDVRKRGHLRVESKFTQHKSYSVRLEDLQKIESECCLGETPAFDVTFVEPNSLKKIASWVLLPREEWVRLLEIKHASTNDTGPAK